MTQHDTESWRVSSFRLYSRGGASLGWNKKSKAVWICNECEDAMEQARKKADIRDLKTAAIALFAAIAILLIVFMFHRYGAR